ncbi:DUF6870 family protein [Acetoanaerobium noterae]|uniref:DUF6870 family protein n=1 Tax=Acetoanaerobium noterae TaxID=745369 RepID=UPI003EBEF8F2
MNIENIKIDMIPCVYKRAEQFLAKIKNPYAFRCGEIAVNVVFSSEGKLLKESVTSYLRNQKRTNESS